METTSKTRPTAATTVMRRDGIDVARSLALAVVVAGHLAMAVVDRRPGGGVRAANLFALRPGWAWLAALAPMPVFFAAGGWANATATPAGSARRLRALVGMGAAVVAAWSAAVVLATAVGGRPGEIGTGARLATQPLWFVAAYLPLAASGAALARLAGRRPVAAVGGCLAGLAGLDLVRFAGGGPGWVAWPGFWLAWGTPWLLGAWWRSRVAAGWGRGDERRAGAVLLAGGGLAAAGLVARAGYAPALIDVVPGARSNTTPPTLYTAVAGIAQVGALMLAAGHLDRWGRRGRRLWSRAGSVALGVYAWHLTALALCVAAVAAGAGPAGPSRLTAAWWATRPLWWAAVLAATAGLVAAAALIGVRRRTPAPARPLGGGRPVLGVVAGVAAAGIVGRWGPGTVDRAVAGTGLFLAAWWLLGARAPARSAPAGDRRRQWPATTRSTCRHTSA